MHTKDLAVWVNELWASATSSCLKTSSPLALISRRTTILSLVSDSLASSLLSIRQGITGFNVLDLTNTVVLIIRYVCPLLFD